MKGNGGYVFLGGLSPEYFVVKINILLSSEVPYMSEAFNRLTRLAMTYINDSNSSHMKITILPVVKETKVVFIILLVGDRNILKTC